MSQKAIIGLLAAIIVLGGGAWYYQSNMRDTANVGGAEGESREKEGGAFDSLKEGASNFTDVLSGKNGPQECHFEGVDPETKESMEGTIYVVGEDFRMEADTVVDGKAGRINMIQHESVMYMWSDDETVMPGIKIDVSMFEDLPETEKPESPLDALKDPNSGMKFDCKGWSPRGDSFEPPADVEFYDMFGGMGEMFGEMMNQGMTEGTEGMDETGGWEY